MPEISRFFGIIIRMFFDDHQPPHLHAEYAGRHARIRLQPIRVLESTLPTRAMSLVLEWCALHQAELVDNWERLQSGQPATKVPPLE